MTKRYFLIIFSLLLSLIWISGCTALSNMGGKSGSTTKTTASQPRSLYSRVPAAMRAPVKEANYDLKRARADQKLADEKVKLAELIEEKATMEKKYADYRQELAETSVRKAEVTYERKKLEAINNANLGDKADNIKGIAKLKTKELDIEADSVNTRASMATLELEIKKVDKKVRLQTAKVNGKRR